MFVRILKIILISMILSSVATLGFLYYRQDQKITNLEKKIFLQEPAETLTMVELETYVDQKIKDIKFPASTPTATTIIQKVTAPAPKTASKPTEFYIPLGSGEVTTNDKWVDIYSAQATINKSNYPTLKAAYFEAVMHIPNAQGELKARLFEATLPFTYGDYLKTQSGTGELVSIPVILQSGTRTYRVQLNSQIGTGVLDSARIRIVTEN